MMNEALKEKAFWRGYFRAYAYINARNGNEYGGCVMRDCAHKIACDVAMTESSRDQSRS